MSKGQAFGVFRLAIFALVAAAIIFLVIGFFSGPKQDSIKEIKGLITAAKLSTGQTFSKRILFEKESLADALKVFDDGITSVSFRCNSSECFTGEIRLDERNYYFESKTEIPVTARCALGNGLYSCIVYFGLKPAQAEIGEITLDREIDLLQDSAEVSFEVKNTGELTATNVQTTIKIYKKVFLEGEQSKQLFAPDITDFEQEIPPGAQKTVTAGLPLSENGEFELEITVLGDEAGIVTKTAEFTVTNAGTFTQCTPTVKGQTFLEPQNNECLTYYHCEKCSYVFECRTAWEEIETGREFSDGSKEYALEITEPVNGQCG